MNHYLSFLGVGPINWLRDPSVALRAVVVATVWWTVGNNVVLFMAGMQQIPTEVYEAAELDGSVGLHRFFRITLPLLRPTAQFVVIMQIIASFQIFGQVNIMTGGALQGQPASWYSTFTKQDLAILKWATLLPSLTSCSC